MLARLRNNGCLQTECAPAPAPAAPAPAVYQYQSQCWDLNNRYQNSNYYSPTPVAPVYQPQAPAYQPQAPAYQPQEPVYGWQKPTNPQYGWNKPGYGPKPKPVYGDDDEVDSFPSNAGYQAQARPSYY
jgi:hypothetical protein